MEQRPLRLGDVVDDYCTRERRVTNHVIVALVEDAIRHTRCTTCDNEHAYKGAREPRLRKKVTATSADLTNGVEPNDAMHAAPAVSEDLTQSAPSESSAADLDTVEVVDERGTEPEPGNQADGSVSHRRLIRATLPPTDEPPPPRPIPEFTMYQRPPARGARFRFRGGGTPNGNGNGNGTGNGGQRDGVGNGRPGQGQGQGSGRSGRHRGKRRPR